MTVAVDFDGVIHLYSKGWHDGTIYDDPVPGALDGIRKIMSRDGMNQAVFIFTCRDIVQVAEWLSTKIRVPIVVDDGLHRFWGDRGSILVTNRKLPAMAYLDDRAVVFQEWGSAIPALEKMRGM